MTYWLSNPKVWLALLVNGMYVVSLVSYSAPQSRPRPYNYAYGARAEHTAAKAPPVYAPLTPASGPSKATTYKGQGTNEVEVYLTNDLTLVRKPGHTLRLSPIYTAGADGNRPPNSVLLRFVAFSHRQVFDDNSPLTITADGKLLWPNRDLYGDPMRSAPQARHSATTGETGQIVETIGETLPYEEFVRIISARSVVITLGPDVIKLNAEQLEALRDMHRVLP